MFRHREKQNELSSYRLGGICSLLEIPQSQTFRIVEIKGGAGLHRRLLTLGFHRGDLVSVDCEAAMRGPVLVRNLTTGARVALGRGIAQKILVEPIKTDEV
ncbi:MAG: FeoA family protein [Acidobacteriota bacterium]|jgi:Fe2+ transport system protein FeoA|nr:FeoA family protein [Acidobacteriota bacterium]MDW3229460.1 FeoA family protein [Acidobacteriota bacterium]MDY0231357.1 FeoA family protein [Candidatus Saccharicenans sp.]